MTATDTTQESRARLMRQLALLVTDLPAPSSIFFVAADHLSLYVDSLAAAGAWAQFLAVEPRPAYRDRDGAWHQNVIGYLGHTLVSLSAHATADEAKVHDALQPQTAVVKGGAR